MVQWAEAVNGRNLLIPFAWESGCDWCRHTGISTCRSIWGWGNVQFLNFLNQSLDMLRISLSQYFFSLMIFFLILDQRSHPRSDTIALWWRLTDNKDLQLLHTSGSNHPRDNPIQPAYHLTLLERIVKGIIIRVPGKEESCQVILVSSLKTQRMPLKLTFFILQQTLVPRLKWLRIFCCQTARLRKRNTTNEIRLSGEQRVYYDSSTYSI